MSRPSWIALIAACLVLPGPPARAAEVKIDRDFLAGVLERLPPVPFETAGRYRGRVDSFRLIGIDAKARQVLVGCRVEGQFVEKAIVDGLSKPKPGAAGPSTTPADPGWKPFRFEAKVAVNVEPGPDGSPRFRFEVDEVRRKELGGMAGSLAKLMGRSFDGLVTAFADKKAAGLNDRLNGEVVKRVAAFQSYGMLTGVDYAPTQLVFLFDQTRFRSEGVVGYVFTTPRPGTVPLYRWLNPKVGDHVYATDAAEPDRRVYRREGVACYVFEKPAPGTSPLYRWRGRQECLYTLAPDQKVLRKAGYRPEGVACYLLAEPGPDAVPFYRFLDPRRGLHFYTTHPHAEFAK